MDARVVAVERGAAEHMPDRVRLQIAGDAAPQQGDRRIVAVRRGDAAAPELEQLPAGGRLRDQRRQVVLPRRIKAVVHRRHDLAQQAIGADDVRPLAGQAVVDDEQVVADRVIAVDVAAQRDHRRGRRRPHLVVENLVAERLGGGDFGLRRRQPDIELPGSVKMGRAFEKVRRDCRQCLA
jgi:hypothetical protein